MPRGWQALWVAALLGPAPAESLPLGLPPKTVTPPTTPQRRWLPLRRPRGICAFAGGNWPALPGCCPVWHVQQCGQHLPHSVRPYQAHEQLGKVTGRARPPCPTVQCGRCPDPGKGLVEKGFLKASQGQAAPTCSAWPDPDMLPGLRRSLCSRPLL